MAPIITAVEERVGELRPTPGSRLLSSEVEADHRYLPMQFPLVFREDRKPRGLAREDRVSLLANDLGRRTAMVSVPFSIVMSGLATMLWYQSGFLSLPWADAKTYSDSPSSIARIGTTCSFPLFAPIVWSSTIGGGSW